jgi:hypothetical protein
MSEKLGVDEDPRKRPLLTAEQLSVLRRYPEQKKKGTPREEFEKLFLPPDSRVR